MKRFGILSAVILFLALLSANGFAQDVELIFKEGKRDFDIGFYREAIEKFKKVNEINPAIADSYYYLGSSYYQLKQFDEAIKAYRRAVRLEPKFFQAYVFMGNALDNMNKYAEAIQAYKKALEIKPDSAWVYFELGVSHASQKNYLKAVESYEKSIQADPKFLKSYLNLGKTYREMNLFEKSEATFDRLIKLKPDYAVAYSELGYLFAVQAEKTKSAELKENAIENFQESLRLEPNNSFFNARMGVIYFDSKQYDLSLPFYKRAVYFSPRWIAAHVFLGNNYLNLNRSMEALASYQRAADLDPDYPEAQYGKGLVYHYIEKPALARHQYKILIRLKSPLADKLLGIIDGK